MEKPGVKSLAKKHGWDEIETSDPYMISFGKVVGGKPGRINVWFGKKGITVGTYLKHPKQGRTQLFRKWVTREEMDLIFKNPRHHTGKGYR